MAVVLSVIGWNPSDGADSSSGSRRHVSNSRMKEHIVHRSPAAKRLRNCFNARRDRNGPEAKETS